MLVALSINIIAILFAGLESLNILKNGLKYAFYTIFLFLALRYDFGNDYMGYLNQFMEIRSSKDMDFFYFKYNEFGWWYLNYFFSFFGPKGFFIMQATIAGFVAFVGYRFIRKYVPVQYYALAVFLYTFQPDNALTLSSAVRQYIAVTFFILSIDFLIKREYIKYLALIFVASLFHSSALILVMLIFLNLFDWKIKPAIIIFILSVFILLINFQKELFVNIETFLILYFDEYKYYTQSGFKVVSFGLGFVLNAFIMLFTLFTGTNEKDNQKSIFFKIIIISLVLTSLNLSLNMASRFSFYIYPSMIVAFIYTLVKLRNSFVLKMSFSVSIIILTLYQYYLFWNSPVYGPYFEKYQTIFSSPYFGF